MNNTSINVRPAAAGDYEPWRAMWKAYCTFYQTDLGDEVTELTWQRIHDVDEHMYCVVAEYQGRVVGFANYLIHYSTWHKEPVCYLEDLFVNPDVRRGGIGRLLIEHLIDTVRENGWGELYWHTKRDNHVARILYDRIATDNSFVRYEVEP